MFWHICAKVLGSYANLVCWPCKLYLESYLFSDICKICIQCSLLNVWCRCLHVVLYVHTCHICMSGIWCVWCICLIIFFCFSPITPLGSGHHWMWVVCLRQVSAWWCPSPLQAEAGMEFTSCTMMLLSQPTGSTETWTCNLQIQSLMCYPLSHHVFMPNNYINLIILM